MSTMKVETDHDGTLKVKLGKGEWAAVASVCLAFAAWCMKQDRAQEMTAQRVADMDHRLERIEQTYYTSRKDTP